MEIGSEFFSTTRVIDLPAGPRPKLLLELEPAHHVFLDNLLDILWFRSPTPPVTTSRPGRFWSDVFVPTNLPWWGFGESLLWHALVVAALWSLSQGLALRNPALLRPTPRRSYISYYRPSPTFPVAGSRAQRPRESNRGNNQGAHESRLRVAREGKPGLVAPPDLKLGERGQPEMGGVGGALPAVPFSATRRTKLSVPAGPDAVVSPPPEMPGAGGHRGGLPQVSAIAPPPEVAATSSRRGLGAPAMRVVEPPPSVKGALRKFGDVNIGHSTVVAPGPQLPMHEQRAGVGSGQSGLGGSSNAVVPPPPSLERSGALNGGRAGSMAGGGLQVVPPPPALADTGDPGTHARAGALTAGRAQVVPPPPSVEGVGNATGRGRGYGGSETALGVVPPSPSARDLGNTARAGRGGSPTGEGLSVVPPPPSVEGAGEIGGGGRAKGMAGTGFGIVPPAPSDRGLSGSHGTGRGGALGGTGLQASGPGPLGGGGASAGRGNQAPGGNGAASGNGDQIASASMPGAGKGNAAGNGLGSGASANGNGGGGRSAPGSGGGGSASSGGVGGGSNGGLSAEGVSGGGSSPGGTGGVPSAGSPAGSPTGSNPDGANLGGGGRPFAADIPRPRPPILDNPPGPQDLPLRVIGLAMALPSSSYFSNYEVFIAERRVSKDESQLIKLVYVSLPYQRRLSEYGLNNRVFKLRVTRDPTCDETLMQMTWPEGDEPKPGEAAAKEGQSLNSDRDKKLPCYRTTADDYRKAMSRKR